MERDLLDLEQQGWRALSSDVDIARRFYDGVLRDDAVMLFPGGVRLTGKAAILASLSHQPWAEFQIDEPAVIPLDANAGVLTYRVRARREDADRYEALIASTYVRERSQWRLVVHQQTPL